MVFAKNAVITFAVYGNDQMKADDEAIGAYLRRATFASSTKPVNIEQLSPRETGVVIGVMMRKYAIYGLAPVVVFVAWMMLRARPKKPAPPPLPEGEIS